MINHWTAFCAHEFSVQFLDYLMFPSVNVNQLDKKKLINASLEQLTAIIFCPAMENNNDRCLFLCLFVCIQQESSREQAGVHRGTTGRRKKHHWLANGHKFWSITMWNDRIRTAEADHQQQPLSQSWCPPPRHSKRLWTNFYWAQKGNVTWLFSWINWIKIGTNENLCINT